MLPDTAAVKHWYKQTMKKSRGTEKLISFYVDDCQNIWQISIILGYPKSFL